MNEGIENREWIDAYQTLKQVNPACPFTVPAGYFIEMEGQVLDYIHLLKLQQNHIGKEEFAVPANYFDELTQNIESRIAVAAVLNTGEGFTVPDDYFGQLASNVQSRIAVENYINPEEGFITPDDYFDQLPQSIQRRITVEKVIDAEQGFAVPEGYFDESALQIQALVAVNGFLANDEHFTVPESYFDELSSNIQARIAIDEAVSADRGFTVPAGYFAGLEKNILAQTAGTPPLTEANRNVVRRLWANAAFKYATAACFSLFVGAAILISEFNDSAIHNRSDLHKAISTISVSDMETYLELNGDAPTIMESADPNSLNNLSADDNDKTEMN